MTYLFWRESNPIVRDLVYNIYNNIIYIYIYIYIYNKYIYIDR
jgi:hypothetical protein